MLNIRQAAELWLEVTAETAVSQAKDLKPGTQHAIMNDAGLTEDDL